MLIYRNKGGENKKSIYVCDRCKKKMINKKDIFYSIYVRKDTSKSPQKKWDLCQRCYIAFYKAINRGLNKK